MSLYSATIALHAFCGTLDEVTGWGRRTEGSATLKYLSIRVKFCYFGEINIKRNDYVLQ